MQVMKSGDCTFDMAIVNSFVPLYQFAWRCTAQQIKIIRHVSLMKKSTDHLTLSDRLIPSFVTQTVLQVFIITEQSG